MKSGLRRAIRNATGGPPVPLALNSSNGRGMQFDLGGGRAGFRSCLQAYSQSGTVFAIVNLLSMTAAQPAWHLYKKQPQDGRRRYATTDTGDDQRQEVIVHPAIKLWSKPNDFSSGFTFREAANQHLELAGETIWVLDMTAGFPTSMWYVQPDRMEPVTSEADYLTGWIYTGPDGSQVPLLPSEVIIEKLPNPLDMFRGAGPVASIMANIQQQKYATDYQRNLFINGADPGGIIQVPSKLSDTEFDELIDRWREAHQGVGRAGRVGILEGADASWIPSSQSNKDLEYGNLRLANRDEIREAWRIHKSKLGTVEDVNRANAETADDMFDGDLLIPRLERRQDTLNTMLLPLFGKGNEDVYEFGYEDPSNENKEAASAELVAKSTAAMNLVTAGYDPTAVLEAVGLPDMPVAEKAVQAPVAPPGWVPELPAAPEGTPAPGPGQAGEGQAQDRATYTVQGQYGQAKNGRDAQAKVFEQAARDYPPDAMAWMHAADWSGPAMVPLDHIDPEMSWMEGGANPAHVQDFVKRLQAGKKLKPAILVKVPGSDALQLVDGHHRYLASKDQGVPLRAFIGAVQSDHGLWETMHASQYGRDDDSSADNTGVANILVRLLNDGYVPCEVTRRGV